MRLQRAGATARLTGRGNSGRWNRHDLAGIASDREEAADKLVEAEALRAGDLDHTVERSAESDRRQRLGDIVGNDRLDGDRRRTALPMAAAAEGGGNATVISHPAATANAWST